MNLQQLAKELSDSFVTDKRNNGEVFMKLRDGSPEWMRELCLEAHGDMGPDDWRYKLIYDAAYDMAEGQDEPDDLDSSYPYTHDRLAWVASRLDRTAYCDEAIEDCGDYPPIKAGNMTLNIIAMGMAKEIDEVFQSVKSILERRLETE